MRSIILAVLVIVVQPQVGRSEVNQVREVSRIELTCALEIVYGVSPATADCGQSIQLTRKLAGLFGKLC